jgi:hypothetical protein
VSITRQVGSIPILGNEVEGETKDYAPRSTLMFVGSKTWLHFSHATFFAGGSPDICVRLLLSAMPSRTTTFSPHFGQLHTNVAIWLLLGSKS